MTTAYDELRLQVLELDALCNLLLDEHPRTVDVIALTRGLDGVDLTPVPGEKTYEVGLTRQAGTFVELLAGKLKRGDHSAIREDVVRLSSALADLKLAMASR